MSVKPLARVGRPVARLDARQRVSGEARYTADFYLPGMLYARVLRSPLPHARIIGIKAQEVLRQPGVHAVLTHQNCRVIWSRGDSRNQRYLFNNPVRFVGDAVAVVAAENRHLAEQAASQIDVQYEELDFVLDPRQALREDSVAIHPGGNLSPDGEGNHQPEIYRRGEIVEGLKEADLIIEDTYSSKHVNNAQMEPRVSIAHWQGDKLTVWAATQGISNCRRDLAHDLNLPMEHVRVICQYMGGGFGNKNQCQDSDLMAALLARETGRPVRLEFTRDEDFVAVHGRWPTQQHYKVGVNRDGRLRAIQLHGYSGMGGYRKSSGQIAGIELYECPHVERMIYPVYTNTAVSANFRAPSYPQGVFGVESLMDDIAHRLSFDPIEFRLRNATRKYHDELPYTSSGLRECLRQGASRFQWSERWRPAGSSSGEIRHGLGVAMGAFAARIGRSAAVLRLDSSGRLHVHVGVTDVGTGAKTTLALIAAEAMDIELDRIEVIWGDTARCPYSIGESGSRTTAYTGWAVVQAAEKLKQMVADQGPPTGDSSLVAEATPDPTLKDVARYSFAAHFAEVAVDTKLGDVRVTRYLAMHDSGRIINPLTSASQVQGGVIQGIGMALHEELLYDQLSGVPLNPGFYGARVMTHLDAPEVEVHFVETEDSYGPFGAKSLGEMPIIPVVGAIANAIFNATGHRFKELPISREKILERLA